MNPPPATDAPTPASLPPSPTRPPARWRPPRWATRGALLLLLLYAAYLLAGNVFLNTPLGQQVVNRKPEKFHMHWQRGLTWWPGQVVLWDVALGGQVRRNQWNVQATRASGHIGLWPLWSRRLRMTGVDASDVRAQVIQVEHELPPPAYRPGGWRLEFPSIRSDSVLGGSWGALKIAGRGSAQVGFNKQLRGGPMQLLPSQADLQGAQVLLRGLELLHAAHLKAGFSIEPHRSAQASGVEKLDLTRISLSVDGATAGLALQQQEDGRVQVQVEPGAGQARGQLAFAEGALRPGGALHWRMPVRITDMQGREHHNTLQAHLRVDEDLHLQATLPQQAHGVLSADVDVRLDGRQVIVPELRMVLPRTSGRVAGRWQFSSLKWLARLFVDAPWLSLDGAGEVEGDLRLDHGVLVPGSRMAVPRVEAVAVLVGSRVEGLATAEATLKEMKGEPRSHVAVRMQRFSVSPLDAPKARFVQGNDLQLTLDGPADLVRMRDELQARARFRNARVPDLRAYNRYLPNAHLWFEGGQGALSGDVQLDAAGRVGRGRVDLRGEAARVRAAGIALTGDVDIALRLKRADLQRYRFDMAGSRVGLRNVSLQDGKGSRSDWWASLDLARASLNWNRQLEVQGSVQARMKNVAFVLDLFSQQKDYPKWIFNLIDAGQAQVTTQVDWRGETLLLRDIRARNDRFALDGQFRLQGERPHGDLYASWGVLGMAVELRDKQRQFHVLGARRWYDRQPRLMP
ncbi:MAG: hypothetical protein ABW178_10655 [Pseudoxanthomonas sp.]